MYSKYWSFSDAELITEAARSEDELVNALGLRLDTAFGEMDEVLEQLDVEQTAYADAIADADKYREQLNEAHRRIGYLEAKLEQLQAQLAA